MSAYVGFVCLCLCLKFLFRLFFIFHFFFLVPSSLHISIHFIICYLRSDIIVCFLPRLNQIRKWKFEITKIWRHIVTIVATLYFSFVFVSFFFFFFFLLLQAFCYFFLLSSCQNCRCRFFSSFCFFYLFCVFSMFILSPMLLFLILVLIFVFYAFVHEYVAKRWRRDIRRPLNNGTDNIQRTINVIGQNEIKIHSRRIFHSYSLLILLSLSISAFFPRLSHSHFDRCRQLFGEIIVIGGGVGGILQFFFYFLSRIFLSLRAKRIFYPLSRWFSSFFFAIHLFLSLKWVTVIIFPHTDVVYLFGFILWISKKKIKIFSHVRAHIITFKIKWI